MRSKIPCGVCGTKSCQSGFVFKNVLNKCTCKLCYTRLRRSEKEKDSGQMATVEEAAVTEEAPLVINLEGMYIGFLISRCMHLFKRTCCSSCY